MPRLFIISGCNGAGKTTASYTILPSLLNSVKITVVGTVLSMMPKEAVYYFTQASVQRAMPAEELAQKALSVSPFQFTTYPDVPSAYQAAKQNATAEDIIYIGGSTFIVADLLSYLNLTT